MFVLFLAIFVLTSSMFRLPGNVCFLVACEVGGIKIKTDSGNTK